MPTKREVAVKKLIASGVDPQAHIVLLEDRGLGFENKEWWYLTLSGGLVTILGALIDLFDMLMQDYVFLAPLLAMLATGTAWYVQLNYKKDYLANLTLKKEFRALCAGEENLTAENHPFEYELRGREFRKDASFRQALTHCMGKFSLFAVIMLFNFVLLVNTLPF